MLYIYSNYLWLHFRKQMVFLGCLPPTHCKWSFWGGAWVEEVVCPDLTPSLCTVDSFASTGRGKLEQSVRKKQAWRSRARQISFGLLCGCCCLSLQDLGLSFLPFNLKSCSECRKLFPKTAGKTEAFQFKRTFSIHFPIYYP